MLNFRLTINLKSSLLLSQQRCADDSGIIAENRLADFSLLLGMLAVSFFFNIFSDRVKKVIALVADSAADAKYLGLENIDYIDNADSNIIAVSFNNLPACFVPAYIALNEVLPLTLLISPPQSSHILLSGHSFIFAFV